MFQAKDKTMMTPLHVASGQGSLAVAKCLINAGADLRSLDEEQMTPLHFACMEGSLEVAQLLFETGECDEIRKLVTQFRVVLKRTVVMVICALMYL